MAGCEEPITESHGESTRPPPKSDDGLAREPILEAAVALFAERGFAATSVGDVCKRAPIGKPAVYWHFESKQGLLRAALQSVRAQWIEHIQKQTAREGDPAERLRRFTDEWRRIVVESPNALRLPILMQLENVATSQESRDAVAGLWQRAERAIADGFRDAGVDVPGLDLIAHTAVTLLQGAMVRQVIEPDEAQLDRVLGEFRRTLSLLVWSRLPADARRATVDLLELDSG